MKQNSSIEITVAIFIVVFIYILGVLTSSLITFTRQNKNQNNCKTFEINEIQNSYIINKNDTLFYIFDKENTDSNSLKILEKLYKGN